MITVTAWVFPASAGINRLFISVLFNSISVPRVSGDKPALSVRNNRLAQCSPRQRG